MSGQALTRDARIAQAAAKAMADAQDARERRDALREGRQTINDALRGFRSDGPRRGTIEPSTSTPEQRAADAADQGPREAIKPEPTGEEIHAAATAAIRGQRFGHTEEDQS